MNFAPLFLGLMALYNSNDGLVTQFGHVDSFPKKTTNEIEISITDYQLEFLKKNNPAVFDGIDFSKIKLSFDSPCIRVVNGVVVEKRNTLDGYKSIASAYSDGWRQAVITVQTNVATTAIPSAIQQVASAYKSKMEEIYGAGAATNRALTRSYVAIDLSLNPAISADTGLRLATWFDILNEYWGKDEIWSYPWGQTSYSVTNVTEVWEAVTP